MGFLRYALSLLVLLDHLGSIWAQRPARFYPSVTAVGVFFALSGFTMTLFFKKYFGSGRSFVLFWAERALRLYPQLIFYSLLVLGVCSFLSIDAYFGQPSPPRLLHIFLQSSVSLSGFVSNYLYDSRWDMLLVPPSWSLGSEMQFYCLLPFLILFKLRVEALIVSALLFLLPAFGLLEQDFYGYRLLPCTLFIYLMGSLLADGSSRDRMIVSFIQAGALLLLLQAGFSPSLRNPFISSVLIAVVLVPPVLRVTAAVGHSSRLDTLLGRISYGLYLAHWPIKNLCGYLLKEDLSSFHGYSALLRGFLLVGGLATLAGALSFYMVERPFRVVRRALMNRGKTRAESDLTGGAGHSILTSFPSLQP